MENWHRYSLHESLLTDGKVCKVFDTNVFFFSSLGSSLGQKPVKLASTRGLKQRSTKTIKNLETKQSRKTMASEEHMFNFVSV